MEEICTDKCIKPFAEIYLGPLENKNWKVPIGEEGTSPHNAPTTKNSKHNIEKKLKKKCKVFKLWF